MELKKAIYDKLVEITRRQKPNEACAFLFHNNKMIEVAEPDNKSPAHFEGIDSQWVYDLIQKNGNPTALFHSHPCAAVPSNTDLQYMITTIPFWGCVWLIMSDKLKLRAWTIDFGSDEFTGKQLYFPKRGETIRPVEVEVKLYE